MSTIIIIGLIILVVLGIIMFTATKQGLEQGQKLSQSLNNIPDFTPEKTLVKMNAGKFKGISIDSSTKKICFINDETFLVKPFQDVIETQINIDGSTVTKTSRGSQALGLAVGGALGGVAGAVIGGLSGSKESIEKIKSVSIQILVNDLNNPVHEIKLSEHTAIQTALDEANQWNSTLKVLIFQNS